VGALIVSGKPLFVLSTLCSQSYNCPWLGTNLGHARPHLQRGKLPTIIKFACVFADNTRSLSDGNRTQILEVCKLWLRGGADKYLAL
jgi:hypothetical protein